MVRFLSNEDVRKVFGMSDCFEALDNIFREYASGGAVRKPKMDVVVPDVGPGLTYRYTSMEGASRAYDVFTSRIHSNIIGLMPDGIHMRNYTVQPGTYLGLVLLFSLTNADLLAIINDGTLQHMRAGATSGIAAKYLAKPHSRRVAILGSGGMAHSHLEALAEAFPDLEDVRVFSPTSEHRDTFAAEMSSQVHLPVRAVTSPEEAIAGADIVCTCTNSKIPVLEGRLLEPGMFVSNVTALEFAPDVHQRADALYVLDQLMMTGMEGGTFIRFTPGLSDAEIESRIDGFSQRRNPSLIDVLVDPSKGRQNDQQIILFNNNGHEGLQFPSVAATIYKKAAALDLGVEVPSSLFLQHIKN